MFNVPCYSRLRIRRYGIFLKKRMLLIFKCEKWCLEFWVLLTLFIRNTLENLLGDNVVCQRNISLSVKTLIKWHWSLRLENVLQKIKLGNAAIYYGICRLITVSITITISYAETWKILYCRQLSNVMTYHTTYFWSYGQHLVRLIPLQKSLIIIMTSKPSWTKNGQH